MLNAERLIGDYLYHLVYAINNDAFYEVEPFLLPDSTLYKSQEGLVERLYDNGISQEVIDFEILSVEDESEERSKIHVLETIGIYNSDGEYREETFEWWYYAQVLDNKYYLFDLE